MEVCGCWKRLLLLCLRLLFVIPAGLPVRSQGDSQSDNKVMDNITVRQGETVFLRMTHGGQHCSLNIHNRQSETIADLLLQSSCWFTL
ncbi:hypothetical protein NFI96_031277 [Prochilodus magdalenae]|nr:hypothetical protein NFI96_031277 [Prochilodus magdalenae]